MARTLSINNVNLTAKIPVFTVIIHPSPDVGGYWAECSMENGGCTTQGDTLQEIQKNMFESVDLYLEDYPEIKEYFLQFEIKDV